MNPRLARLLNLVCASALGVLGWLPAAHADRPLARSHLTAPEEDPSGARVIVRYKALGSLMRSAADARGPQHAAAMAARTGLALRDGRIVDRRTQVLRGQRGLSSAALAAQLASDAEVEYAVPDLRRHALAAPNDPLYAASSAISPAAGQWYLRAPDSTFVSAIDAAGAWALTTGSSAIVVADVDTGVRFDHPDLRAKLYPGYDFVSADSDGGFSSAADGDGRDSDASDPGDWTSAGQCGSGESATDSSWHGTQTAGLIGAQTNNGVGMASVGYKVMVLPVRALGKCGGYDSDIIAGMLWAAGITSTPTVNPHPARVINLSLGSSGSCSSAYTDAISQLNAAGVVVVAAAGNEEGLAVGTPANCSGVIAVTGVRHTGTKVGFSSVGPQVAIAAPGGNCVNLSGACLYPLLTTTNAGVADPGANIYSDSSGYSVGTSFATPLVSGTAALMLAANPSLTPAGVKRLLQSSARTFPATSSDASLTQCHAPNNRTQDECLCTTSTCGAGLLDARAAVAAAVAGSQPTVGITASASTVTVGDSVTFDGSASVAPSGRTIASYAWTLTSGSDVAAFSGATDAATARVSTLAAGTFTARLTVTDSAGVSASRSTTVTVNAVAAPVVRVLASTTTVAAGNTVTFDGSGSTATSGRTIVGYQWAIGDGAALASFTSGSAGSTATVITAANGSGTFTVVLTVTDSAGQQASSRSSVTVDAVGPTASFSASTTAPAAGSSVAFDASPSTAPGGRTIARYRWAITAGSAIAAFSGSTTNATATVLASAVGSFTIELTVTDSAGVTASRAQTYGVSALPADSSGGGGGGATSGAWLLGLAAAVAALAAARRDR